MLIGYARVSTYDQNLNLQQEALQAAGCERIFTDIASGALSERSGLNQTLDFLRQADTLVVWRLDRLGRSLSHLLNLVNSLENKGIGFKSLMEFIDTATAGGKLFFQIFGALADYAKPGIMRSDLVKT